MTKLATLENRRKHIPRSPPSPSPSSPTGPVSCSSEPIIVVGLKRLGKFCVKPKACGKPTPAGWSRFVSRPAITETHSHSR
jgi:hypothetical protein